MSNQNEEMFGHLRLYESFYDARGELLIKVSGQAARSRSGRKTGLFLFEQTDRIRRSETPTRYYVKRRFR